MSAEGDSTADARAPTSAAVPGPLPSQITSSTTHTELLVKPTGSFLGPSNIDINLIKTAIAGEILNHFYRSNIPDSAFSGLDFNQPDARNSQIRQSSTIRNQARDSSKHPAIKSEHPPPFTLPNGQVVSVLADGLVIGSPHGTKTLPCALSSTLANSPSSELPPLLARNSNSQEAPKYLGPQSTLSLDALEPRPPGNVHTTRKKNGSNMSAGPDVMVYIGFSYIFVSMAASY